VQLCSADCPDIDPLATTFFQKPYQSCHGYASGHNVIQQCDMLKEIREKMINMIKK
jgi:hypothetical protein